MNFTDAWLACQDYTMLEEKRGRVLWDLVQAAPAGELAELGVYQGGSALLLYHAAPDRRLHLFDTFAGHPEGDRTHDDAAKQPSGRFSDTSLPQVLALFPAPEDLLLYIGRFPQTLTLTGGERFAFVHLDCDLYDSVHAGLEAFWPRLVPGGVIVSDDYGFPDCPGAKRAVDAFCATAPGGTITLPGTGQAILRKAVAPHVTARVG